MNVKSLRSPIAMILAVALVMLGAIVAVPFAFAGNEGKGKGKYESVPVTICHANNGSKGFTQNTVDDDAIWNQEHQIEGNGHASHQGGRDIIPTFTATNGDTFAGQNLTTMYGDAKATGQEVLDNGCAVPEPESTTPPFDHDWTYPAPTCDAGLTVTYPSDLPTGQAIDVNVKVKNLTTGVEQTFNFRQAGGAEYSGTQSFDPTQRDDWPDWSHYAYVWTQVAGSNYHWAGNVECGRPPFVPTTVTAKAPVQGEPTCQAAGSINAPEGEGYTWSISKNGLTYTAVAAEGYELEGKTEWTFSSKKIDWKDAACKPAFTVEQQCGSISMSYANNSTWDRWPDYTFEGDGVDQKNASGITYYSATKVGAGATKVIFEKTFDEDFGDGLIDVTYQDRLGAERDIDTMPVTVQVDTDCVVPPTVQQCESFEETTFADLTDWDTSGSKSGGSSEVTSGGLEVHNPQGGKSEGLYGHSFDLEVAGSPSMEWTGTGTAPGLQMGIDLDGNGSWDGTLVNEAYNYAAKADQWWFSKTTFDAPVASDYFSDNSSGYGTLDEWLAKYPNANVRYVGYALGTGPAGDGVITQMTFGCKTFTFEAPVTTTATPDLGIMQPVCTAVPGEHLGQTFTDGSVTIPEIDGVKTVYVFNGADTSNGKPSDLGALAVGEYNVIATPAKGYTFDGALSDGWKLSPSGKATFAFTIDAADDCWVPIEVTPVTPEWDDQCGADVNITANLTDVVGVTFEVTETKKGLKVVATPDEGYILTDKPSETKNPESWQWTKGDSFELCDTTPVVDVTPAQCTAVPGELFGQDVTAGAVTIPEVDGVKSVYVFNGTNVDNGKPADLNALAPGDYLVIATPENDFSFDGNLSDGWEVSPSGKATYTFTIEDVDCWEPIKVTPVVPTVIEQCGTENDEVVLPEAGGITYEAWVAPSGDWRVKATVQDGYVLTTHSANDETVKWFTFDRDTRDCLTALPPVVEQQCGIGGEAAVTFPEIDGINYSMKQAPSGDYRVKATVDPAQYILTNGSTKNPETKWYTLDLTLADSKCEPTEVTPVAPVVEDQCGTESDGVTVAETTGVTYSDAAIADDGSWTVTATADAGYTLTDGEGDSSTVEFSGQLDTRDCVTALPAMVEQQCGLGADAISFPEVAGVEYSTSQIDGAWVVTAAVDGSAYSLLNADEKGGSTVSWTVDLGDTVTDCPPEPVVVEPVAPTVADKCGDDVNITANLPGVDGITYSSETTSDGVVVTASPNPGFVLAEADGQSADAWTWTFTDSLEACPAPQEPVLTGSTATGECLADAPWIFYDVAMTDPDGISTGNSARIVLTDGTETATIELGELSADGILNGKVLWPGASVAEDGVTPTGWPGWAQAADGTWVETASNYAWTRGDITATLEVNPEVSIDLAYPPATPDCASAPPVTETPTDPESPEPTEPGTSETPSTDGESVTEPDSEVLGTSVPQTPEADAAADATVDGGLASTGSNAALLGLAALGLLTIGAAVFAVRRRA